MKHRMPLVALALATALAAQAPTPAPAPSPAPAPAPASEPLRALLQQLRGLDAKAWQDHQQQLEQQAAEFDRTAAAQLEQAKQLTEQATLAGQRAKALRDEQKQLEELRKLLLALPPTAAPQPASPVAPPTPPAVTAPAVPAPPAAEKPAAKEPVKEPTKEPTKEPAKEPAVSVLPAAAMPATASNAALAAVPVVAWGDVEPLFLERCADCHDPDNKKGGFDLSSFAAARSTGGSGKAIVPGQPEQSRLFLMISRQERPFMPKDADPLEAQAIAKIRTWIEQGAAEDAAAARAFLAEKEAKAKAVAAAVDATMSGPPPLPENLPTIAVRYPPRAMPVPALVGSPRAPLLALAGCQQLLLLDGALQNRGVLPCDLQRIGAAAFSWDGRLLAAAGGEAGRRGKAFVYEVTSGKQSGPFGKERDVPLAVAVHQGKRLVAIGGSSKHVRGFDLDDGSEKLDGKHDDFVLGLDFSPDGTLLAAADRSGAVVLWEVDGGRIAQVLRGATGAIHAVAFHRSGRMLAVAAADGTVRMFDANDGKERWQKKAHQGEALALAFGPGNRLASGGSDGRIQVFDVDGKGIATSDPVGDQIQAIAFGDSDDIVIGGDALGRLHRFSVPGKTVAVTLPFAPVQ